MKLTNEQVLALTTKIINSISDFAMVEVKDLNVEEVLFCLEVTKQAVVNRTSEVLRKEA